MKPEPGCDRCIHREENAIKDFCDNPKSIFYKTSPQALQKLCPVGLLKDKKPESIKSAMVHNAIAYNKMLNKKELKSKSVLQLLTFVHHLDRREFAILLSKNALVTTQQIQEYLKK